MRWNYTEVLAQADPGHTIKTQGVFSTLPGNGDRCRSASGARFRDQVIGTAILLLLIIAVTDLLNTPRAPTSAPFIIGLIVVAIGMAWGTNAGYAINPARDFGPRLASFITGYGGAWRDQYGDFYFWVPIVGPLIGGLLGAGLYKFLIGRFLPPRSPRPARVPPPTGVTRPHRTDAERGDTHGGLRRRGGPGNHQHPIHDLRPRRQRGGEATSWSTRRSSRAPAGSSTTRWRSGNAPTR